METWKLGCNSENQLEKARKLQCVGKTKVSETELESRDPFRVITGVPLSDSMSELVKCLRVHNSIVKMGKRMTRGMEKKETESILVEFETKEIPKDLYFEYVRYTVRKFTPKAMKCFKCQDYGHIAKVCKGKRRCARFGGDHEYVVW